MDAHLDKTSQMGLHSNNWKLCMLYETTLVQSHKHPLQVESKLSTVIVAEFSIVIANFSA